MDDERSPAADTDLDGNLLYDLQGDCDKASESGIGGIDRIDGLDGLGGLDWIRTY